MNATLAGALLTILGTTGCASRGVALRPTRNFDGSLRTNPPPATAWVISTTSPSEPSVSCSFVEFDERGDYLDFEQHTNAWKRIRQLSTESTNGLILVIYCHGWKNNVQSGDVVEFNHFLLQVARSKPVRDAGQRVHGLYLGWRGNVVEHYLDPNSSDFEATSKAYGGPIVDLRRARSFPLLPTVIPENLSYWDRKGAAEYKVSGVPMARTVFTCAGAAKATPEEVGRNHVFVMGHSFGALMLEKCLGQACISALTASWPWSAGDHPVPRAPGTPPPLPFDGILFLNSAAPSIHTKEFADFLWAHSSALRRAGRPEWDSPTVVSLTSEADSATGVAHRWANVLACLYPSLQRSYRDGVLAPQNPPVPLPSVPQSFFYEHTPGHNPLLVNRWFTSVAPAPGAPPPPAASHDAIMAHNLDMSQPDALRFYTSPRGEPPKGQPLQLWEISKTPWGPGWNEYLGHRAVNREGYYIIRCDERVIRSHGDIWNQQAQEAYAGLFRMVTKLREPARLQFKRELRTLQTAPPR